jgi:hypothetical protein
LAAHVADELFQEAFGAVAVEQIVQPDRFRHVGGKQGALNEFCPLR